MAFYRLVLLYPNTLESKLVFIRSIHSQNHISIAAVLFCTLNSKFAKIKGFSLDIVCLDKAGHACIVSPMQSPKASCRGMWAPSLHSLLLHFHPTLQKQAQKGFKSNSLGKQISEWCLQLCHAAESEPPLPSPIKLPLLFQWSKNGAWPLLSICRLSEGRLLDRGFSTDTRDNTRSTFSLSCCPIPKTPVHTNWNSSLVWTGLNATQILPWSSNDTKKTINFFSLPCWILSRPQSTKYVSFTPCGEKIHGN